MEGEITHGNAHSSINHENLISVRGEKDDQKYAVNCL